MSIIGWIIIGALAGWIASMLTGHGEGLIGDIIIGILGALVGGFLYGVLAHREFVAHFNLGTLLVAVVGAALLQLVFAALRART